MYSAFSCLCEIVCKWVYLQASHPGWEHESHVISMDHGEDTDSPGCNSPGVLKSQLLLTRPLWIFKHDLKHLCEVLAQMVGCGTLRKHKAKAKVRSFWIGFGLTSEIVHQVLKCSVEMNKSNVIFILQESVYERNECINPV